MSWIKSNKYNVINKRQFFSNINNVEFVNGDTSNNKNQEQNIQKIVCKQLASKITCSIKQITQSYTENFALEKVRQQKVK